MLELTDYAIIAFLMLVFRASGAVVTHQLRPVDQDRFQRIEQKLDLILAHLEIEVPEFKLAWQEVADDPERKIEAIKMHREHYHLGLAESKRAVEDYIAGKTR